MEYQIRSVGMRMCKSDGTKSTIERPAEDCGWSDLVPLTCIYTDTRQARLHFLPSLLQPPTTVRHNYIQPTV